MAEVGEQKHGNQIATTCVSIISEIDLLDSGQLLHSQKMEAVGQLTGGLAHDFNNLLAVIRGNAEMLEDRLGHDDKALDAIIRSVARGAALTNRLLTFSRQPQLNAGPFDLAELIAGMLQLLSRTLGETIEIETRADPDLWLAVAEADQAENAFLNLAINARDAMPEGGKLTIECQNARLDDAYVAENPEATAGDYVMLAVSDQGTGMSAQVLANAFKPFFTTKEIGQGSGLGLSMIHGFAKQSGGHATIQSEIGDGTTVRLYLPRHIGMADR